MSRNGDGGFGGSGGFSAAADRHRFVGNALTPVPIFDLPDPFVFVADDNSCSCDAIGANRSLRFGGVGFG